MTVNGEGAVSWCFSLFASWLPTCRCADFGNKPRGLAPFGLDRPSVDWRLRMIPYDHSYDSILGRAGYPYWERVNKDILS